MMDYRLKCILVFKQKMSFIRIYLFLSSSAAFVCMFFFLHIMYNIHIQENKGKTYFDY
jgi:hypothetical protein